MDPANTFATNTAGSQTSDGAGESFEANSERKFHSLEVFLAGFIASMIAGLAERYLTLAIIRSQSDFIYISDVTSVLFFLVNPFLVFLIMYFWLGKRLISFFRERFLRICVLLFLAGGIGITISAISELVLLYSPGSSPTLPTFTLGLSVLDYIVQAVDEGFSLMFVGLAAITIAFFRKAKKEMVGQTVGSLKARNTEEPGKGGGSELDDIKGLPDNDLQKELVSMKTIEHVLVPLLNGRSQKSSAHSFEMSDMLAKARIRISLIEEEQQLRRQRT
jgi:hypothetical protein